MFNRAMGEGKVGKKCGEGDWGVDSPRLPAGEVGAGTKGFVHDYGLDPSVSLRSTAPLTKGEPDLKGCGCAAYPTSSLPFPAGAGKAATRGVG